MPQVTDGTVLPAYLLVKNPKVGGSNQSMRDVVLRFGEVVDAFPPNDPQNKLRPPNQWEYIVHVTYRDAAGSVQVMPYRCTMAEGFGSLADHVRYTVRKTDAKQEVGDGTVDKIRGAIVLILCPNGDRGDALIVGARRPRASKDVDPSETFFDFEFNGVRANINKDGALSLQVPGPTKVDGTPGDRDSNNHGSSVTFGKDGVITVDDHNGQKVVLDSKNKKVEVHGKDVTVYSDNVQLGDDGLTEQENGVVVGGGIDYFTGRTYWELQNASKRVKAKRR